MVAIMNAPLFLFSSMVAIMNATLCHIERICILYDFLNPLVDDKILDLHKVKALNFAVYKKLLKL